MKKITFEPDQGSLAGIETVVTAGPWALGWHMPAVS